MNQIGRRFRAPLWAEFRPYEQGERWLDFTADFATNGDSIPSLDQVSAVIERADGWPLVPGDLVLTGNDSLDPTGLILSIGFEAPAPSAGVVYRVTVTIDTTALGAVVERAVYLPVAPWRGIPTPAPPTRISVESDAAFSISTSTAGSILSPGAESDPQFFFDPDSYIYNFNNYGTLAPEAFLNIQATVATAGQTFSEPAPTATVLPEVGALISVSATIPAAASVAADASYQVGILSSIATAFSIAPSVVSLDRSSFLLSPQASVGATLTVLSAQQAANPAAVASMSAIPTDILAMAPIVPAAASVPIIPNTMADVGLTSQPAASVSASAAVLVAGAATIPAVASMGLAPGQGVQQGATATVAAVFTIPPIPPAAVSQAIATLPVTAQIAPPAARYVARPVSTIPTSAGTSEAPNEIANFAQEIDTATLVYTEADISTGNGVMQMGTATVAAAFDTSQSSLAVNTYVAPAINAAAGVTGFGSSLLAVKPVVPAAASVTVPDAMLTAAMQALLAPNFGSATTPNIWGGPSSTVAVTAAVAPGLAALEQIGNTIAAGTTVAVQPQMMAQARALDIAVTGVTETPSLVANTLVGTVSTAFTVTPSAANLVTAIGSSAAVAGVSAFPSDLRPSNATLPAATNVLSNPSAIEATQDTIQTAANMAALIATVRPSNATLPAVFSWQPGITEVIRLQPAVPAITVVSAARTFYFASPKTVSSPLFSINSGSIIKAFAQPGVAGSVSIIANGTVVNTGTGPFSNDWSADFQRIGNVGTVGAFSSGFSSGFYT